MSSFLTEYEINQIRGLMTLAQFRGREGAGVAIVPSEHHTRPVEIIRTTDTADALVHGDTFRDIIRLRCSAIIGHARLPTTGGLSVEDCHPHTAGHIIGVHNGTLEIVNGYKVNAKTDLDSQILFAEIAEHGVEKVIPNTKGAYALTWIDKNKKTINFLRNQQRSLCFAHSIGSFTTLYWASEPRMLWYIFGGGNAKMEYKALPENVLYSFRFGGTFLETPTVLKQNEKVGTKTSVPAIIPHTQHKSLPDMIKERRAAAAEKPEPKVGAPGGSTFLEKKFEEAAASQTSSSEKLLNDSMTGSNVHVQYGAKFEHVAPLNKIRKILSDGCLACHDPACYETDLKTGQLHWFGKDMFMCKRCYDGNPTNRLIAEQLTATRH